MSSASDFYGPQLEAALSEIDEVRRILPETTLVALAEEVVARVAKNLLIHLSPEIVPSSEDIDTLCHHLLAEDPRAAANFIETFRMRGYDFDRICINLLSVAAQRLGLWWEQDQVSFYRVTVAAGRIYAILRALRMGRAHTPPDMRRAAVFAAVPGEQHTLGVTMATDLARERGWDIDLLIGLTHDELLSAVLARQPAIIGLSASGKRSLPALGRLIVALHIIVPNARILVSGQVVTTNLVPVGLTGADAAALEFEPALQELERFLTLPLLRAD